MYFMPKGFFKIPIIKGDMAQKPLLLFTMYGAPSRQNLKSIKNMT